MFCVACCSWEDGVHRSSCSFLSNPVGMGNYSYIGLFTYIPGAGSADQPRTLGVSKCGECHALIEGIHMQDHEDWHMRQRARWGEVQKRRIKLRRRTK